MGVRIFIGSQESLRQLARGHDVADEADHDLEASMIALPDIASAT
jgi:hypothetical protein